MASVWLKRRIAKKTRRLKSHGDKIASKSRCDDIFFNLPRIAMFLSTYVVKPSSFENFIFSNYFLNADSSNVFKHQNLTPWQ
jgi:hypothetical protein